MKRCILFLLFCICFFSGCGINLNEYPGSSDKPFINYYSSELAKDLSENQSLEIMVFETNLSSEVNVSEADKEVFISFLGNLKEDSFIANVSDYIELPKVPAFKLYIKTYKNKYVINVYNEKVISLYPWDGLYEEDFLTMEYTPKAYNLHSLCKYILSNK